MSFDPDQTGVFEAYRPESKLLNVVLAVILMLALVGMLVFAVSR